MKCFSGFLMSMLALFLVFTTGCVSMVTPKTLDQQIYAAQATVPTLYRIAANLVLRGRISVERAAQVNDQLLTADQTLILAKVALGEGNNQAATDQLLAAQQVLAELEKMLNEAAKREESPPPATAPDTSGSTGASFFNPFTLRGMYV